MAARKSVVANEEGRRNRPQKPFLVARSARSTEAHPLLVTMKGRAAHQEIEQLLREKGRVTIQVASPAREPGRSPEELQNLAGKLLTSQEREWFGLARALHDDVSQRLALFEIAGEEIERQIGVDPTSAQVTLRGLRAQIAGLAADVRVMAHRLYPAIIEDLGLAAALRSLAHDFHERASRITTFKERNLPASIPADVALGLYRIAQEALRNLETQAGRRRVELQLYGKKGVLIMRVVHFGTGLVLERSKASLGLICMEERATQIGAALRLETSLGKGTKITVEVPGGGETQAGSKSTWQAGTLSRA